MIHLRLFRLLIIAALLLVFTSESQAQWVRIIGKGGPFVTSFATCGSKVYAGSDNGIIVSTDSGVTWNTLDLTLVDSNVTAMIATETDIFAGIEYGSIYETDPNGYNRSYNQDLPGPASCFAAIWPYLYAPTTQEPNSNQALGISTNMGSTWKLSSGNFETFSVNTIVASPYLELFAGTNDSGIIFSLDFGNTWQTTADHGIFKSIDVLCLATEGNNVFAGTQYYGIYRSTDDGQTWTPQNSGLPSMGLSSGGDVSALYTIDSCIYAGTSEGIYLSTDSGITWLPRNTGLFNLDVRAFGMIGSVMLAGTYGDGIFRSTNSGLNWLAANTSLYDLQAASLFLNGNALFAGPYNTPGVVRLTDEGATWQDVGPDPGTVEQTGGVAAIDKILFLGTRESSSGRQDLYMSTDNGSNWNFDSSYVGGEILAFDTTGPDIFVGTNGGNICFDRYRRELGGKKLRSR